MATRKLPGTCLFVIFLCQFLKRSVEPLERRSAAPCVTVKSPRCLSGRRAGRRRREQPQSPFPHHVFTRLRLWRQALNLEWEVHSGSRKCKRKPVKLRTTEPIFFVLFSHLSTPSLDVGVCRTVVFSRKSKVVLVSPWALKQKRCLEKQNKVGLFWGGRPHPYLPCLCSEESMPFPS